MKVLTFLLCLVYFSAFSQDKFDASLIPVDLKSRANAVVREDETIVDMSSTREVIYFNKQAITVLNKNGERNAALELYYDKSSQIKNLKGFIYNEYGKLIAKFGLKDFSDESAVSDFSLFEDTRVKRFFPNQFEYPFTIVYEYELLFKQNLIIPSWYPKPSDDIAVEKSSFTFLSYPDAKYNTSVKNIALPSKTISNAKHKSETWSISHLPATKSEPFSPPYINYLPSVKIAPEIFSYYNYNSSYKNWKELGKWIYDDLLKDVTLLPQQTIEAIHNLTRSLKTDQEKAKKIYEYMQSKTRYISIQIGIGGFKPFKASSVDQLGYGDCKALVVYMQALLNVVNIPSYYSIVFAGDEKRSLDPSFASMNQANHVILCLPFAQDTTWLECTNQEIPYGYLSDFTDDRMVLACTPEGGKIMNTPKYTSAQNSQVRKMSFQLDMNRNISGKISTQYKGLQYDTHSYIANKPFNEQKTLLVNTYDNGNITFDSISFTKNKATIPVLQEELLITISSYGTKQNEQYFLPINPVPLKLFASDPRNRTRPIYVSRGLIKEEQIIYKIGSQFKSSTNTIEKNINTDFGIYSSKTTIDGDTVTHYRFFELREGNYPETKADEFFKFLNDVTEAEKLKIVLMLK